VPAIGLGAMGMIAFYGGKDFDRAANHDASLEVSAVVWLLDRQR